MMIQYSDSDYPPLIFFEDILNTDCPHNTSKTLWLLIVVRELLEMYTVNHCKGYSVFNQEDFSNSTGDMNIYCSVINWNWDKFHIFTNEMVYLFLLSLIMPIVHLPSAALVRTNETWLWLTVSLPLSRGHRHDWKVTWGRWSPAGLLSPGCWFHGNHISIVSPHLAWCSGSLLIPESLFSETLQVLEFILTAKQKHDNIH